MNITYEEALKELAQIKNWTNFYNGCYKEKLEAINMAIETLEKQIPKKPISKDSESIWNCPRCEKEIYWDTDYGQQRFAYCTECGQAIDWDDEEE